MRLTKKSGKMTVVYFLESKSKTIISFQEFADEDWDDKAEDEEDVAQWQEDWDDDDVDDDFCNTLRLVV